MKIGAVLLSVLTVDGVVLEQTRQSPREWHATMKVIDDAGAPMAGTEIWVSHSLPPTGETSQEWDQISWMTDSNGVFIASHTDPKQNFMKGLRGSKVVTEP